MAKKPTSQRGHGQPQAMALATHYEQRVTTGPIPSSDELERYDKILPGAAERILAMAEANQARRHHSERFADESNRLVAEANARAMDANVRASDAAAVEARRGQWMAYSLAIIFLAASVGLALMGKEIVSSVLGGGVVVALVTAFIKGSRGK